MINLFPDDSGAFFSPCGKYRYVLWRKWSEKPMVMFIGLNPSTADAVTNDNTITKVIKVAQRNGYGGLYMTNLFGFITPHPDELKTCDDPVGENDKVLQRTRELSQDMVFCWGNFPEGQERSREVIKLLGDQAKCFKQNKNGSPKHPLYCLDETVLIPFDTSLLK